MADNWDLNLLNRTTPVSAWGVIHHTVNTGERLGRNS